MEYLSCADTCINKSALVCPDDPELLLTVTVTGFRVEFFDNTLYHLYFGYTVGELSPSSHPTLSECRAYRSVVLLYTLFMVLSSLVNEITLPVVLFVTVISSIWIELPPCL